MHIKSCPNYTVDPKGNNWALFVKYKHNRLHHFIYKSLSGHSSVTLYKTEKQETDGWTVNLQ